MMTAQQPSGPDASTEPTKGVHWVDPSEVIPLVDLPEQDSLRETLEDEVGPLADDAGPLADDVPGGS